MSKIDALADSYVGIQPIFSCLEGEGLHLDYACRKLVAAESQIRDELDVLLAFEAVSKAAELLNESIDSLQGRLNAAYQLPEETADEFKTKTLLVLTLRNALDSLDGFD